jgi:hypothetical protein
LVTQFLQEVKIPVLVDKFGTVDIVVAKTTGWLASD